MIRSLFDIENMPEDAKKEGDAEVKADFESAETESVAEKALNETVAEKEFYDDVAGDDENVSVLEIKKEERIPERKPEIKHLPADEIISQLNKREEFAIETSQERDAKPLITKEEALEMTPADESSKVLEETAKIETEEVSKIRAIDSEPTFSQIPPIYSVDDVSASDSNLQIEEPTVLSEELPEVVNKTFADDTFLELQDAANKIEREAQTESAGSFPIPFNDEINLEDEQIKHLEEKVDEIQNELLAEKEAEAAFKPSKVPNRKSAVISSIFDNDDEDSFDETSGSEGFSIGYDNESKGEFNTLGTDFKPESKLQSIRRSGMAYSAVLVLLAAVVFMMIIGWGADLLLGTSPWGVVGGIVIGSIIGFVQFFRVTSQIFKDK